MNRIDRDFVAMLNVLSLLREKPMTYEELMKSGCFKTQGRLSFTLYRLKQAGCIEKIKAANIYVILGHGITLSTLGLNGHPNFTWRPLPFEVLDVVEPLGRMKELYEKGRSS
jgi:hypothetical protein